MILAVFDEICWYSDQRVSVWTEVGFRTDLPGLPRKEGVCLYIQRVDARGRPHGLCRLDMTPTEAHKLAQTLELEAKALAGKFTPKQSGD